MGPERLTAPALALLLAACSGSSAPGAGGATMTPVVRPSGRLHVQMVTLAKTAERLALLDRLRKTSGPAWVLGKDGPAEDDVDPFRVYLRRAWRIDPVGAPRPVSRADAEASAIAFVTANADLLGMSPADVVALDVTSVDVPKHRDAHLFGVRFQGSIPMRGYEYFEALASTIDLVVFVDTDGQIRAFTNLSRVHPRLALDTRPMLDAEDARVVRAIVGREVFVNITNLDEVSPSRRVSLGRIASSDVVSRQLTVYVSTGPMGAYVTYHLAYAVLVHRQGRHFFRYVVSADTGDLLEDADVPVVPAEPWGEL